MTDKEKIDHTNDLVEDIAKILKVYLIKMGVDVIPEIKLKPVIDWRNILEIKEVIRCADSVTDLTIYPEGIRTKKRHRTLVLKRQVVIYICRKMGYLFREIGNELDLNHATAIHGEKMINDLLSVNNMEITKVYNEVLSSIHTYYKESYGKDISKISI